MKISLCMIVKNEENNIVNCLDRALEVVDETIIVDTGSTDKTKLFLNEHYAKHNSVKIIDYKWEDDFSKARNESLKYCTGDWILVLDADERIFLDRNNLEAFLCNTKEQVFIIPIYNVMDKENLSLTSTMIRLFKNNNPRFKGAIHEQIVIDNKMYIPRVIDGNICKIFHYGYCSNVFQEKNKQKRNMELIKAEIDRRPKDPFNWYNKGTMEMIKGNYNIAIDDFLKSHSLTNKKRYTFHNDLILALIICMMALERYKDTIEFIRKVSDDIYVNKIPDIYYYCGIAYLKINKYELAIHNFKKAINLGEYEKGLSRFGAGSFLPKIKWSKVLLLQNKKNESINKIKEAILDNRNINNIGLEELIVLLKEEKKYEEIKQLEQIINNKNTNDSYLSSEFFRNKDHVKNNITTLVEGGKLEVAKELILEYEKIVEDDIDVYSIKGVIAMMEGKMKDAERILKEGLSKDENYFDLLYNLAYLYQYNKQNQLAIEYYKKSLHITNDEMSINKINDILNSIEIN